MKKIDNIKVEYDGEYPCLCMGKLHILIDNKEVYVTKDYSFSSTGSVWFDEEWDDHVEEGELIWSNEEEKKRLDKILRTKYFKYRELIWLLIKQELGNYVPCCGGCI